MRKIDKEKAVELRRKGCTYNEISKELNVNKSTLSGWLSSLVLTKEEEIALGKKCRFASISNGKKCIERWNARREQVKNEYSPPLNDPFFMLGIGLYWGEGDKYSKSTVGLSNSDPSIARIFIKWIMKFFKEDFEKFSIRVQHYDVAQDEKIKNYWSKELGVPLSFFQKSYYAISRASKKLRYLQYGTIKIIVNGKGVWKTRQKIQKALDILFGSFSLASSEEIRL